MSARRFFWLSFIVGLALSPTTFVRAETRPGLASSTLSDAATTIIVGPIQDLFARGQGCLSIIDREARHQQQMRLQAEQQAPLDLQTFMRQRLLTGRWQAWWRRLSWLHIWFELLRHVLRLCP